MPVNLPATNTERNPHATAGRKPLALVDSGEDKGQQETFEDISEFLRNYQPEHFPHSRSTDLVDGRYRLRMSEPLPEFDGQMAQAFAVTDEKMPEQSLFAMVSVSHYSYRQKSLNALKGLKHPNLMELVTYGVTEISTLGAYRLVLIFEKPKGKKLSTLFAEGKLAFPDRILTQQFIAPITQIISLLAKADVSHQRINLDNIYFGEKMILGECVSEPAGYSQHFLFEPPGRVFSMPIGKGEGDTSADCYALGVLAVHLSLGFMPHTDMKKEDFLEQILELGSYNTITAKYDFSDYLQDLLRGTLNDYKHDRWSHTHIEQWLGGKRYNLIHPSLPKEAPRPFEFEGKNYFSRRALAYGLFSHWEEAQNTLRDNKLSRWLELSLHRTEVAEGVIKIIKSTGGEANRAEKYNREMVARICTLLDPYAPLRLDEFSISIDGIGATLAEFYHKQDMKSAQVIVDMIDFDLPNFSSELQEGQLSVESANTLWKLQKVRIFIRMQGLGFGLERVLYDLNPHMPCQSPLVASYHVTSLPQLIYTLDMLAKNKKDIAPLDRHIAAFIASKLDTAKEIRILELQNFPTLRTNSELCALKILGHIQEKNGRPKLHGLSAWLSLRILSLLNDIHNRKVRADIQEKLRKAARTGILGAVAQTIINADMVKNDFVGFMQATQRFNKNAVAMKELKDKDKLRDRSIHLGETLSIHVSFLLLGYIFYTAVKQFLMH